MPLNDSALEQFKELTGSDPGKAGGGQSALEQFNELVGTKPVQTPAPKPIPKVDEGPRFHGMGFSWTEPNTLKSVFDQYVDGLVNEFTFGGIPPRYPPATKTETAASIAGRVTGAVPALLLGSEILNKALGYGIKTFVPAAAKPFVALAARLGFTAAPVIDAIKNSKDFKAAIDANDMDAAARSGSGILIDSIFTFLISKGWYKDALKVKELWNAELAKRFAAARNITPEAPAALRASTIAEAEAMARQPREPIVLLPEHVEASPELKAAVEAKTNTVETSKKIVEIKNKPTVEKPPEIQEDRSKIDQSETMVTLKQMEEMEKATGKPFDELSDQEIEDYFTGKLKAEGIVAEPEQGFTDEDIEKFYGKSIDKISDDEIDKFLGIEDEAVSDVDITVGTEKPEEIVGEESIFDRTRESVNTLKKVYENNSHIANNIDEAFLDTITNPKDIAATAWKLNNDVNRWKYGENVDIEKTRNFISEIAARADEFIGQFENVVEHRQWKQTVSEMADWARGVKASKRSKIGTSLYFGFPLDEAGKIVKHWYSVLREAAEQKLPRTATGQQILNTLRKPTTKDEWEAVGLSELLEPGRKYSKDEVLKLIDEGTVEFKDVLLKESTRSIDDFIRAHREVVEEQGKYLPIGSTPHDRMALFQIQEKILSKYEISQDEWNYFTKTGLTKDTGTKYGSYVEPGGTNYKELFVTAPSKGEANILGEREDLRKKFKTAQDNIAFLERRNPNLEPGTEEWHIVVSRVLRDLNIDEFEFDEFQLEGKLPVKSTWQDGHADYSDIENPIVRLRMNDRYIDTPEIADLQNELREIEARIRGIESEEREYFDIEAPTAMQQAHAKRLRERTFKFQDTADNIRQKITDARKTSGKVLFLEEIQPPIPSEQAKMPEALRKRWREIGMKRAIKYAIDGGYDKLAWTTGEMQARRYSLEHFVDKIHYSKEPGGGIYIEELDKEHKVIGSRILYTERDLAAWYGADIAKAIIANEGTYTERYQIKGNIIDVSKTVGNTGLRKLYNQDLPNVAKKLGGEVEEINLNFPSRIEHPEILREGSSLNAKTESVPSISISPIKQKISKGFSLYSGLDPYDAISRSISTVKEFFDEFDKSWKLKDINFAEMMKHIKADTTMALIDQSETLLSALRKRYPHESERIINRQRSAAAGVGYGSALYEQAVKEIYGGKTDDQVRLIHAYVLARRLKDIYGYKKSYKTQPGYGRDQVLEATKLVETIQAIDEGALKVLRRRIPTLDKILANLTPKQIAEVVDSGEKYFEWHRKLVDDIVAAELKTEEEGRLLKSHDFRKFRTLEIEQLYDLSYTTQLGGTTIKATNSGIESLGHGSTKIIDPDSKLSMHEMFIRAYGAIANQAAKQQWRDLAVNHPDNGIVMVSSMYGIPKGWRPIKSKTGDVVYVDKAIVEKLSPETKRIGKRATNVLAEYYAKHPDSPAFKKPGPKVPPGWSQMPIHVKGEVKSLYFHPDAAKYLVTRSHDISKRFAMVAKYATLAPVTRALAVGTSPMWATFAGLPMDFIHTLWTAKTFEADEKGVKLIPTYPFYRTTDGKYKKVYDLWNPASKLKLGKDIAEVARDIYTRGPFFMNLMKHGLAMPFLTMRQGKYMKGVGISVRKSLLQGKIVKQLRPETDLAKIMDIVSYHGTSQELLVRAATANRVIKNEARKAKISYEEALKNDDIMYKAVHAARDRMDYNQGGWLIKAIDQAGFIFLNAGILATRTFWRQAKNNPIDFGMGILKLASIAVGITAAAWVLYEDETKEIPVEGNERNITFPLFPGSIEVEDNNGDIRHFYARLRTDPNAALIYKFFEAMTRKYLYDKGLIKQEPDLSELFDISRRLGPVELNLPPVIQMNEDYRTNFSRWQNRQIYTDAGGRTFDWPNSVVEGMEDRNVSQMAKNIAKVTKLSPKRLDAAKRNVIPNNEFAWAIGAAYEAAFSDVPKEVRAKNWLITLAGVPGINRVIGLTSPGYQRGKVIDKVSEELALESVVREGKFERLVEEHAWYDARPEKDVTDFIAEQDDQALVDRMSSELEFAKKIKGLTHRSKWLSTYKMSNEGKAKTLVRYLNNATDREKRNILDELGYVQAVSGESSGYNSDEFTEAIAKYVTEKGMSPSKVKSLFETMWESEKHPRIVQ